MNPHQRNIVPTGKMRRPNQASVPADHDNRVGSRRYFGIRFGRFQARKPGLFCRRTNPQYGAFQFRAHGIGHQNKLHGSILISA